MILFFKYTVALGYTVQLLFLTQDFCCHYTIFDGLLLKSVGICSIMIVNCKWINIELFSLVQMTNTGSNEIQSLFAYLKK